MLLQVLPALAMLACTAIASARPPYAIAQDPDDWNVAPTATQSPVYILDPITPSGVGIVINMPNILGEPHGWNTFRAAVRQANQLGLYLYLNNISGPRNGQLLAQTFEHWTYDQLVNFVSALAGSRVPILLYVGPFESADDTVVVNVDRLVHWLNDVTWISQITGARAGLIVDASSLYTPGGAPDGTTPFNWFSIFAQAAALYNIEVGFEAWRRYPNGTPYEDRRHYALLQYVVTRFATLPASADADARTMSAIDALPPAVHPLRNTVVLDNATWLELADGDPVPQEWLDAWGITADQLQWAVANRLYAKGYGLIFAQSDIVP
ncbi:MAG: hypothetical protein R3B57_02520 [Phycisphaerales bacterium]